MPFSNLTGLSFFIAARFAFASWPGAILALMVLCAVSVLFLIAALSRHKKAGSGYIQLIGANGNAHGVLNPKGHVIVNGDVWPAISVDARKVLDGESVHVIGATSIRLEVEAVTTPPSVKQALAEVEANHVREIVAAGLASYNAGRTSSQANVARRDRTARRKK
jgi:membrane protein implicated in regulation of membrane protease activity